MIGTTIYELTSLEIVFGMIAMFTIGLAVTCTCILLWCWHISNEIDKKRGIYPVVEKPEEDEFIVEGED